MDAQDLGLVWFRRACRFIAVFPFVLGTPNLMSLVLIGVELSGAPMWMWHASLAPRLRES